MARAESRASDLQPSPQRKPSEMFPLSVREPAEPTKSCSKQHKKVVFGVAPAAVKLTKEAQPIANFSLAECKQIQGVRIELKSPIWR